MSMVFAGFMSAVSDDMQRREDKAHEKAQEEARNKAQAEREKARDAAAMDRMERQAELNREQFDYEWYAERRAEDAKFASQVDFVVDTLGIPPEQRPFYAGMIENGYKPQDVIDLHNSGRIVPRQNGSYGVAPMNESVFDRGKRFTPMLEEANARYELPEGYLTTTAYIESTFDPRAKNDNSSATGLFQFLDGTARDMSVDQLDPQSSTDGAARYASQNMGQLHMSLGRDLEGWEVYLAHQQGPGGARKLLTNPDGLAVNTVGVNAVKNNGGHVNMTNAEFAGIWKKKYTDAEQVLRTKGLLNDLNSQTDQVFAGVDTMPADAPRPGDPDYRGGTPFVPVDGSGGGETTVASGEGSGEVRVSAKEPMPPSGDLVVNGEGGGYDPRRSGRGTGLTIGREPADLSKFDGASSTKIYQALVSGADIYTERQQSQLRAMAEIARRNETQGEALTNSQLVKMPTSELEALSSISQDGDERSRISTIIASREQGMEEIAPEIAKLTTPQQVYSYQLGLEANPDIPEEVRAEAVPLLVEQRKNLLQMDAQQKLAEGKSINYHAYLPNGELDPIGRPVAPDGAGGFVDASTGQPIEKAGRLINPANLELSIKTYNDEVTEVSDMMANGVNAIRDMAMYQRIAESDPRALNQFVNATGGVAQVLRKAVNAAGYAFGADDEEISFDDASNAINQLVDLNSNEKRIAQAQLRAAYAIASMRGSSGQALSDRELQANLNALGSGTDNPERIATMVGDEMRSIIANVETKRRNFLDGTFTKNEVEATFSGRPLSQSFEQTVMSQIGEFEPELRRAMSAMSDLQASPETLEAAGMNAEQPDTNVFDPTGRSPQEAVEAFNSGMSVLVTEELVAADPSLEPMLGKTIRKTAGEPQ